MNSKLKSSLLTLGIAAALSACGGGGGGAVPGSTATPVTSSGAITQFGSVYVNGVRYTTTAARVTKEDGTEIEANPSDDRLKQIVGEGNIVKVRGTINDDNTTGTASTIIIDNELVGTIEAGSITDATFVVLGQTISVSPDTFIDDSLHLDGSGLDKRFGDLGRTLASLVSDGLMVEISGFVTANGLEASRIEDFNTSVTAGTDDDGTDEIKGFVRNLDATPGQFQINGLTIDYSGVISAPALANGDLVEVHGTVAGGILTATSVELEDDLLDDDFNEGEVEVEGIIESITPTTGTAGVVKVNGVEFTVADISQYSVGMKIEIKARLQNGQLQVTRIQDETEDNIRIRDQATGTNAGAITTRLGLNVTPSDRSRLELNDADLSDINAFLTGVQSGDYVEARGFELNGSIVWTRIEVETDSKAECRLRGPVEANPANPTFTIEGVTVTTNGGTQFRDASGLPTDAASFFGALSEGDVVQARSTSDNAACQTNNLNPAKEVSFEPGDDVLEDNGGNDDTGFDDNGGNGNDDNGIDNELKGPISNITGTTFDIAGQTISYDGTTLIDDSIVEAVDGGELASDQLLSTLSGLSDYVTANATYVVTVDGSFAALIEDF
jgi:hypothetical protein